MRQTRKRSQFPLFQLTKAAAFAGKARAIAGPIPLHNAPTPSMAIVFLAQSRKPEYVPVAADCILDLITCQFKHINKAIKERLPSLLRLVEWRSSTLPRQRYHPQRLQRPR